MLRLLIENTLDRRSSMRTVKLREISELKTGPFGTQFSANEYILEGTPVINVKNIGYGDIITTGLDYVGIDTLERLADHKLREGDIVFGRKGSVDRHCLITKGQDGWMQGSDCIRVRFTDSFVLPDFVSYYLLTDAVKAKINNSAVGSTMASLNTDILGDIEINLPSHEEQSKIAATLSAIDRKIRNNNCINDYLQQMAYTKYMHMFYGKKSNGKLDDIIVEQPKSTIQVGEAKEASGTVPFFTSGEAILKWPEALTTGRNCFLHTGGNADVKFYVGESAYSTDTWCISAKNDMADYLYLLLDSIRLELNLKFFQGTGLKHLQKPILRDRPIYIPSDIELREFNIKVKPWLSMISDNIRESEALISLRDWLLPMLMNGQASIQD